MNEIADLFNALAALDSGFCYSLSTNDWSVGGYGVSLRTGGLMIYERALLHQALLDRLNEIHADHWMDMLYLVHRGDKVFATSQPSEATSKGYYWRAEQDGGFGSGKDKASEIALLKCYVAMLQDQKRQREWEKQQEELNHGNK